MDVYFYCNYTNSQRGFFLTKICNGKLEPVSLYESKNKGELLVDRFFSYDNFHLLWMELPEDGTSFFNPEINCSFLGIRSLNGEISGRNGYLDLAFLANKNETDDMEYLVRGILSGTETFKRNVFECLSVGGKNGYELNTEKFSELLDKTANSIEHNLPFSFIKKNRTQRNMLKFGVLSGSWEEASCTLGPSLLWKLRPKEVIDIQQFKKLFS